MICYVNVENLFLRFTKHTVSILSVGVCLEGKNKFFDTNRKDRNFIAFTSIMLGMPFKIALYSSSWCQGWQCHWLSNTVDKILLRVIWYHGLQVRKQSILSTVIGLLSPTLSSCIVLSTASKIETGLASLPQLAPRPKPQWKCSYADKELTTSNITGFCS